MIFWFVLRWVHLLVMAFFVGGQLILALAVVPVERQAPDRERPRAIARRFGYGTLGAIAVLDRLVPLQRLFVKQRAQHVPKDLDARQVLARQELELLAAAVGQA